MLLFDMDEELSQADYRRVYEKLSWLSGVLGEVDEWLESRSLPLRNAVESHERSVITLKNLDGLIARESS
jgi:hypothetical protein